MSVSEPRAALRDALAAYLTTIVAPQFPADSDDLDGLLVFARRRPLGKNTPASGKTIAIATPGSRVEVTYHRPTKLAVASTAGTSSLVTYSYGVARVPLQIDAWAPAEAIRDLMVQAVEAALNRPPAATLLAATGEYARARGLVIRITNFYNAPASFRFGSFPQTLEETSSTAQGSRWRAIWQGVAQLYLVDQQTMNLMKTITVKQAVNGGPRVNYVVVPAP